MTYHQLGQQFMAYLIESINLNYANLAGVIKPNTCLSINGYEGCGLEQFMQLLYQCQFSDLRIDVSDVFCQPIYWNNYYKLDYDGIVIFASGSINIIEGNIIMRRNIYINLVLENINGGYYINNMIVRLSGKGKQITAINNQITIPQPNPYQNINPYYYNQYGTPMNLF